MKATILKRVTLPKPVTVSEEIKQVARDAAAVLGYSDLADKVLQPVKLSDVLRALDIQPFDPATVRTYQDQRREQARDEWEAKHKKGPREYFYWVEEKLSNMAAVPVHVLRKAIAIKRAAPEVKLTVNYLTHDPDPFLVVSLGKEKHWVEVWDEREFENGL